MNTLKLLLILPLILLGSIPNYTKATIAKNTQITIKDKSKQTQDISKINTNTKNSSYTLTKINTQVLDIRDNLSKEISKDGFKAVGDYAMAQASKGDKSWEDGGVKKTLAHAAVGAAVAGVGNGNAINGAIGAGAREALSPLTKDKSNITQQIASTTIGAIAGGSTGASVALDGEKNNRQLHQREIAFLKDKKNIEAFARSIRRKSKRVISTSRPA